MILLLQSMQGNQRFDSGSAPIIFGCLLFAAILFIYIFTPSRTERAAEKTRLVFLYERKEQTFENLRDLNFEYKAGKLSDADFHSMRNAMEQEAANILAEIEQLENQPEKIRGVNA